MTKILNEALRPDENAPLRYHEERQAPKASPEKPGLVRARSRPSGPSAMQKPPDRKTRGVPRFGLSAVCCPARSSAHFCGGFAAKQCRDFFAALVLHCCSVRGGETGRQDLAVRFFGFGGSGSRAEGADNVARSSLEWTERWNFYGIGRGLAEINESVECERVRREACVCLREGKGLVDRLAPKSGERILIWVAERVC